jgi:hypothetical protein
MTEGDTQVSPERWVIDACRLVASAQEELDVALEPEEILEVGPLRGIAALLAR